MEFIRVICNTEKPIFKIGFKQAKEATGLGLTCSAIIILLCAAYNIPVMRWSSFRPVSTERESIEPTAADHESFLILAISTSSMLLCTWSTLSNFPLTCDTLSTFLDITALELFLRFILYQREHTAQPQITHAREAGLTTGLELPRKH